MSVVELLKTALKEKNWAAVEEAYSILGGSKDELKTFIENTDTDDARLLAALYHDTGETPLKRKRGRPKKIKPNITLGSNRDQPRSTHAKPVTVFNEDFTVVRPKPTPKLDEDGRRAARLEEFKPPEGPNKFDPNIQIQESDPLFARVNDNVAPVSRTRSQAVTQVPVFCQDCQKTIMIHPQFKREPYYCEYPKLKRKCPYSE